MIRLNTDIKPSGNGSDTAPEADHVSEGSVSSEVAIKIQGYRQRIQEVIECDLRSIDEHGEFNNIWGRMMMEGLDSHLPNLIEEFLLKALETKNVRTVNIVLYKLMSFGELYKNVLQKILISSDEERGNLLMKTYAGRNAWLDQFRSEKSDRTHSRRLLWTYLTSLGLDPPSVLSSWQAASSKEEKFRGKIGPDIIAYKNLEVLSAIEAERPDIARVLHREYGICNFGRYDARQLIEQYDEREKKGVPHVAFITAKSDWNGFASDLESLQYKKSSANYKGIDFRCAEAGSKRGLLKRIASLYKQHGPIAGLVYAGHGNRKAIEITQRMSMEISDILDEYEKLSSAGSKKDLDHWLSRLRRCFTKDACIVLQSCCVGQKDGIAQKLSELFGITVIAADDKTSLGDLTFRTDEGDMWVDFPTAETKVYFPTRLHKVRWNTRRAVRYVLCT